MGEIISANDVTFEDFIHEEKTVIVDFWAPTCAPCRLLEPGLEKIAFSHPDLVKVIRINVNESPKDFGSLFHSDASDPPFHQERSGENADRRRGQSEAN